MTTLTLVPQETSDSKLDVLGRLTSTPRFRTFIAALVATELIDDLRAPGPFVVLAPTDEAFEALGRNTLERLFARRNVEVLIDLAEQHIATHAPSKTIRTLFGDTHRVEGDLVMPFGARIIERLKQRNGVVLVIDRVLGPTNGRPRRHQSQ